MKGLLLVVLALAAAAIQTEAAVTQDGVRVFHECMRELGIKSFQSEDFRTKFVCINVCEHEKAGMVINGKYLEHKYIEHYVKNFPKAGPLQISVQAECVREANKQSEKCNVGRSLQKCEMENHNLLYIAPRDYSVNNEIEEE